MRNAAIRATGMYVPEREIPNSYFDEYFGEPVGDWLVKNLDIHARRWCRDDESTADLVEAAAKDILERAGVAAEEVDMLIVSTDTPEYLSPSTASVAQHRLGLKKAATFDLNTACAGFVTAMDVASRYIRSDDRYRYILVIGAYAMSKFLNADDKKTVTLFADGAAGCLLEAVTGEEAETRGWQGCLLSTEGQYADWMGVYAGGSKYPTTPARMAGHEHQLQFTKRFPKEINPENWTRMIGELCDRVGTRPTDVDQYFFTQLNINSIRETLDNVGVPHDKAHTVMQRYGYTGSACIPMALHDAFTQGKVKQGDRIFLVASGGGLSFAAASFGF
ncbi:MAG: 3-oxoacyl-ACP synthase III family protein [Bradymonadia bacterium]